MKQKTKTEIFPINENFPIPHNRINPEMPSAVRDFAELLAEIAVRQLRSTQKITQGDHLHV